MLASEYILIDISLISYSPLNEHNRALEYTFSFLSLISNSTGLKEHRISAQQKALDVRRKQSHIYHNLESDEQLK